MKASKVVIYEFNPIEICEHDAPGATKVTLERGRTPAFVYWYRPAVRFDEGTRIQYDGRWPKAFYNFVPLVLWSDGSLWAEASAFILSRLELLVDPDMLTLSCHAEDLAEFARFIEVTDEKLKEVGGFDWLTFGAEKHRRPTYKFRFELGHRILSNTMSVSRAKRCMGLVIRFYRWLIAECALNTGPNSPWVEGESYVEYKDSTGFSKGKVVKTTDLKIRIRKADEPWSGTIDDGGKLMPLSHEEQDALIACLRELGNTEMRLIFLVSLITGARIQTVLTMRLKHAQLPLHSGGSVSINTGPGTRTDTKGKVKAVLRIDMVLYEQLRTYAHCQRAIKRRNKAPGGDHIEQYLFLSNRGLPLYESKEDSQRRHSERGMGRTQRLGNTVRKFMRDYLIPKMRQKLQSPDFDMQYHDLRATFGLNYVDSQMPLVSDKRKTHSKVMDELRTLMWHKSYTTTERYLKYRENWQFYEDATAGWRAHVAKLAGESGT